MLAPEATTPMANPFRFVNQVAATVDDYQHSLRSRYEWDSGHTLRRADEEAGHAHSGDQALRKPDQAIVALVVVSVAIHDAKKKGAQAGQYRPSNQQP